MRLLKSDEPLKLPNSADSKPLAYGWLKRQLCNSGTASTRSLAAPGGIWLLKSRAATRSSALAGAALQRQPSRARPSTAGRGGDSWGRQRDSGRERDTGRQRGSGLSPQLRGAPRRRRSRDPSPRGVSRGLRARRAPGGGSLPAAAGRDPPPSPCPGRVLPAPRCRSL